jgi:hypothetical protein
MPELRTYNVFVSHSWKHDEDYDRLEKMLNDAPNFRWRNFSVPWNDPLSASTDIGLARALRDQISPASITIILAGMYANNSKWIQKEIDIALEMRKSIIAVKPWGQERIPTAIQDVATEIVGWNTPSIVSAIRNNCI